MASTTEISKRTVLKMAKDPAVLIYYDKWIASTNGIKAPFRSWYMDLLMYQYDNGSIPNDEDTIAGICRVLPSEYDLFKQMVKQILQQKFSLNESGCYVNNVASEILSKRISFKEKRTKSGTIGGIVKLCKTIKGFTEEHITTLKNELFDKSINDLEKYKNRDLLKQMLKLYINVDVNEDINIKEEKGGVGEKTAFSAFDFLIKNTPERVNVFMANNKSLFGDKWAIYLVNFESNVTQKEIPWESNKLFAELERLKANWNFDKPSKTKKTSNFVKNE